jgi:hypothetical protein
LALFCQTYLLIVYFYFSRYNLLLEVFGRDSLQSGGNTQGIENANRLLAARGCANNPRDFA